MLQDTPPTSSQEVMDIVEDIQKMTNSLAGLQLVADITLSGHQGPRLRSLIASRLAQAQRALRTCTELIQEFTPIFRLPPDVLVSIFTLARNIDDRTFMRVVSWPPLPLTVSHVCTSWRRIALSHPLLWTSLNFFPPWKFKLVDLYLARSQSCPIDLRLVGATDRISVPGAFIGRGRYDYHRDLDLYARLEAHLPRLNSILVDVDDLYDDELLFSHFKWLMHHLCRSSTPLPLLRSLHFVYSFPHEGHVPECIFPRGTPALVDVKIGVPFTLPSYDNLVSLHVQTQLFTPAEFHAMLSECRRLETLAIYDNFADSIDWPEEFPCSVHLPSLSALHLYRAYVAEYLRYISAPKLYHLTVAPITAYDWNRLQEHETFPTVRRITLQASDSVYLQVPLRCFPAVEHATLADLASSLAELNMLIVVSGDPPKLLWPRLHTLALNTPIPPGILRYRRDLGSPLRRLYLSKEALAAQRDYGSLAQHMEIIERDLWEEHGREGMYYNHEGFGI